MLDALRVRLAVLEREYGVTADNVEVTERQWREAKDRQQQVIGACLALKQIIVEEEAKEQAKADAAKVARPSVSGRRAGPE